MSIAGRPRGLLQRRLDSLQSNARRMNGMVAPSEKLSQPQGFIGHALLPLSCLEAQQPFSDVTCNLPSNIGTTASVNTSYALTHSTASTAVMSLSPSSLAHYTCARTMSYSLAFMSTEEEFVDPSQTFYDNTFFDSPPEQLSSLASIENSGLPIRSTHVDILMRIIKPTQQADQESYQSALHPSTTSLRLPTIPRDHKSRKRYRCSTTGCDKAFCRKAYLEIHSRVHTGVKPFLCKEPTCGQRFSQQGNRKTHERRHTGERPYHCDICGKSFRQHGNVRAHKVVHTAVKPYECKLDNCGKHFTQLGNLKSHQNKFHINTLLLLKDRFKKISEGDVVKEWDKVTWDYFAELYKNCDRSIKGRGKDTSEKA